MTITVELRCPDCDSARIIRHGTSPQGGRRVQRFRCRECARTFLRPDQRHVGYDAAFKETVLRAYRERSSMRGIARIFGISRNTLVARLREKGGTSAI